MPINPKGSRRRPLQKQEILTAQSFTRSGAEAARYLHVNYATYKKHAMDYGIFDQHLNASGKGIRKRKHEGKLGLDSILANQHPTYDRTKLKKRLIDAKYLKEECSLCKFKERRILDGQVPLVLHTLDDPNDLRLKNLCLLCFNCSWLTTGKMSKKLLQGKVEFKFNVGVQDGDLMNRSDVGSAEEMAEMMREIRRELEPDEP